MTLTQRVVAFVVLAMLVLIALIWISQARMHAVQDSVSFDVNKTCSIVEGYTSPGRC